MIQADFVVPADVMQAVIKHCRLTMNNEWNDKWTEFVSTDGSSYDLNQDTYENTGEKTAALYQVGFNGKFGHTKTDKWVQVNYLVSYNDLRMLERYFALANGLKYRNGAFCNATVVQVSPVKIEVNLGCIEGGGDDNWNDVIHMTVPSKWLMKTTDKLFHESESVFVTGDIVHGFMTARSVVDLRQCFEPK